MKHQAKLQTSDSETPECRPSKTHKKANTGEDTDADAPINISDIFEALPFYVMLIDEKHHILQANSAVRNQLGLTPGDIIGKYCPEVIHGTKESWYGCPLEEAVETGKAAEREALDEKSGCWIKSLIYPTGKVTRDGQKIFFHMVVDITSRKLAEESLTRAKVELQQAYERVTQVQEEERKRIARELHDDIAQSLAILSLELDSLMSNKNICIDKSLEKLKHLKMNTDRSIQDIRRYSHELHPSLLDHLGLPTAVEQLVQETAERGHLEIELAVSGEERKMAEDVELALFRITQEALNNIRKHAQATKAIVKLNFSSRKISLIVSDNGRGFARKEGQKSGSRGSLGLISMRERANLVKGKININSSKKTGTTISVEVPL